MLVFALTGTLAQGWAVVTVALLAVLTVLGEWRAARPATGLVWVTGMASGTAAFEIAGSWPGVLTAAATFVLLSPLARSEFT
jgi:hypothetical protein